MKQKVLENKFIYFDLHEKSGSDTLLVIMSGISGGKESFLIRKSLQFFRKYNLDILCINFCKDDLFDKSDCPRMHELTFPLYIEGLRRCIESSNKKYRDTIFIGHSFSAIILILFLKKYSSLLRCSKLILWDPSIPSQINSSIKDNFIFDKVKNIYKTKDVKYKFLPKLSKKFVEDLEKNTDIGDTLRTLDVVVLSVGAEKGAKDNAIYYSNSVKGEKLFKIIKNTGHMFGANVAKKELFNSTIEFITNPIYSGRSVASNFLYDNLV